MNGEVRRQFLKDYSRIRSAEGRGSPDPEYYRALPYCDLTGKNSGQWEIRAKSYRHFETHLLQGIEEAAGRPLDILDLGAGNGWMSYRLKLRNHRPVALDIFADSADGLRAIRYYPEPFPSVEAEFDQLPFADNSFDLIIFNSSIHYSTDYRRTLAEVRRCLRRQGQFIIIDTPVYRRREHGQQMRCERHADVERQYGFRSDSLASIEFFDEPALDALARDLNIEWTRTRPWYGLQWALRPLKARLNARRPPSKFFILTGRFRDQ